MYGRGGIMDINQDSKIFTKVVLVSDEYMHEIVDTPGHMLSLYVNLSLAKVHDPFLDVERSAEILEQTSLTIQALEN